MSRFDENEPDFDYYDEFPQDDPFERDRSEQEDLRYQEEVIQTLLDSVESYLEFSTFRSLIKLIGGWL